MNFDNLVEDAEKHGANLYRDPNGDIVIAVDELQALITQYILADRAQGQEPVGDIRHWNKGGSGEFAELIPIKGDLLDIPHGTKLFTRAQPTPAQIAEAQIDILRKAARHLLARISLSYDDILSHAESTNYDDVRLAASDTESDACANALLDLVDKLRKGEPL